MNNALYITPALLLLTTIAACTPASPNPDYSQEIDAIHLIHDIPVFDDAGMVNIVVEIPAGGSEKWEVNKRTGALEWEQTGDSGRVIHYLPYPANYGMIPRTWLPSEQGGDNDPLDVFLLGPALERGSIQPARIIGIIKILDGGEQDDKLLAVAADSWFAAIHNADELERSFPGVSSILTTWLASYKGPGIIEIEGLESVEKAHELLQTAATHYAEKEH